jgi:hypothetical protein
MSKPKKYVRTEPLQRIDQPDFQHAAQGSQLDGLLHAADHILIGDDATSGVNAEGGDNTSASAVPIPGADRPRARAVVLNGFEVTNHTTLGQIVISSGTAILGWHDPAGGVKYGAVSAGDPSSQIIDVSAFSSPGTEDVYVWVRFEMIDVDYENRFFWNPVGTPVETARQTATRAAERWNVVADTRSPGEEWLPIARFQYGTMTLAPNSGGGSNGIYDLRDLYFEGRKTAYTPGRGPSAGARAVEPYSASVYDWGGQYDYGTISIDASALSAGDVVTLALTTKDPDDLTSTKTATVSFIAVDTTSTPGGNGAALLYALETANYEVATGGSTGVSGLFVGQRLFSHLRQGQSSDDGSGTIGRTDDTVIWWATLPGRYTFVATIGGLTTSAVSVDKHNDATATSDAAATSDWDRHPDRSAYGVHGLRRWAQAVRRQLQDIIGESSVAGYRYTDQTGLPYADIAVPGPGRRLWSNSPSEGDSISAAGPLSLSQLNEGKLSLSAYDVLAGVGQRIRGSLVPAVFTNIGRGYDLGTAALRWSTGYINNIVSGTITSSGAITSGNTITADNAITAGTTVTAGTGVTASTGHITAVTGNIDVTAGDVNVPVGDITATAGKVAAATLEATTAITAPIMTATGDVSTTGGNLVVPSGQFHSGGSVVPEAASGGYNAHRLYRQNIPQAWGVVVISAAASANRMHNFQGYGHTSITQDPATPSKFITVTLAATFASAPCVIISGSSDHGDEVVTARRCAGDVPGPTGQFTFELYKDDVIGIIDLDTQALTSAMVVSYVVFAT